VRTTYATRTFPPRLLRVLRRVNTNDKNVTAIEADTRLSYATTARIVTIAVLFAVFMLLTGCEYAIPVSISRNARKIQTTLNLETASGILQKYVAANDEHGGLSAYDYESVGNEWVWMARGTPTLATVIDGVVTFEAGPDKDFKKFKKPGKSMNLPSEDATPSWFANSKFEIRLTNVRGVVFWDRVHSIPNKPRERIVDLQWSDPEDTRARRPPGARSGTLTLHVQEGNNDELIAALRYFAPTATFTAAR
jgi:hypothetical protein